MRTACFGQLHVLAVTLITRGSFQFPEWLADNESKLATDDYERCVHGVCWCSGTPCVLARMCAYVCMYACVCVCVSLHA